MRASRVVALGMLAFGGLACRQPPHSAAAQAPAGGSGLTHRDELLLAAANVGLPPGGDSATLPDPSSRGARLLKTYCAQCHDLPSPRTHSATDWPSVARRMWLRAEWLSPSLGVKVPSMGERYVLLEYLTGNALKVSTAELPAGKGRETFMTVCSRCHALPDPRVHSKEDWPTVFARMERNMDRMKVPRPVGEQATDILLYLQAVAMQR
jgi:cytochrome c5